LTVLIAAKDNRSVCLEVTLPSETLNSACKIVVSGLPREAKEKLLRDLARECGYHLEPIVRVSEDFQRKLFLDNAD
jgi:hypothetical protein